MRTGACLLPTVALAACKTETAADNTALSAEDSAFAALQERGSAAEAMGVDQYASAHLFDDLPDGGRIEEFLAFQRLDRRAMGHDMH